MCVYAASPEGGGTHTPHPTPQSGYTPNLEHHPASGIPVTQQLIQFEAEPETQAERCRRILSGDVGDYCQTAARYFTEPESRRATRLAVELESRSR